jgi:hypothetical protein
LEDSQDWRRLDLETYQARKVLNALELGEGSQEPFARD